MDYLYGEFSKEQIRDIEKLMHDTIHRLLLYKDKFVEDKIFNSDEEFKRYFENVLFKFGGLNKLLGYPNNMVILLATLQAAYEISDSDNYTFKIFRKAILDSHGYIQKIFEEVV